MEARVWDESKKQERGSGSRRPRQRQKRQVETDPKLGLDCCGRQGTGGQQTLVGHPHSTRYQNGQECSIGLWAAGTALPANGVRLHREPRAASSVKR